MNEPRIVWAVTSGEYSSWDVDALFERREDAEAAVAVGFGDDVQEYQLYPPGFVPSKIGYWEASALVTAQGSLIVDQWPNGIWVRPATEWTGSGFVQPPRPRLKLSTASMGRTFVSVEAMTEEEARKACSDAVAKLGAEALEREQLKSRPGQKPTRR